jgi:4'-phosphopantetheinyl transferase
MPLKRYPIDQLWHTARDSTRLSNDEVHVWRLRINPAECFPGDSMTILSADEIERKDRLLFQTDKNRFAATRVTLRRILGSYMGISPEKLTFRYGSYGKPCLSAEDHIEDLRFNVSHTHDLALIAVSRKRDVGIDVEQVRAETAYESIAHRIFSASELRAFHKLPPSSRMSAFYATWTQKEALVKALGQGISFSFDRIEVLFDPRPSTTIFNIDGQAIDSNSWWLISLHPAADYRAALAAQGPPCSIRFWDCPAEYAEPIIST